jgi:hypothetical protein
MTARLPGRAGAVRAAIATLVRLIGCVFALGAGGQPAWAQSTDQEFWPEVNVFVKTSEQTRLMFLASRSRDREYANAVDSTTGVHFDVFTQRLPSWWLTALPSMEQHWGVWFRFGYNHIVAFDGPGANENRWFAETTLRSKPLLAGVQVANRSRIEARDIKDQWSWRYRNRTRIERTFESVAVFGDTVGGSLQDVGLVQLSPYVMLEFFYDSRISGWSRRYLQAGVEFEFARGWGLDLYMAAQDGLNGSTASVNALGVVLTLRY